MFGLWDELKALDYRISEMNDEINGIAQTNPDASRLQWLPGIGPITATALIAGLAMLSYFTNGRQMAALLGLTPK